MIKSLRLTVITCAAFVLCGLVPYEQSALAQTANDAERVNVNVATNEGDGLFSLQPRGQTGTTGGGPTQPQTGGSSQSSGGRFAKFLRDVKVRERNFPERNSRVAIGLGSEHISAVFRGFRQGAGLAAGIELSSADAIPQVEFRLTAQVSTKLYRLLEVEAYIPKIVDDKTHADIWFNYTRRTRDNFFGIGPRVSRDRETNYSLEQRSFNAGLFRDFTPDAQAGVYMSLANTDAFRGEDDDDPSIDVLFSGNPSVVPSTRFLPGLNTGSKILSFGVYGLYDKRDNERGLTRGGYLYGRISSNDGLRNGPLSDYGWFETELDGRAYIPIFSDKTSLAFRAFTTLKEPKGGSQIPFYNLSFLGGRGHVRGYDSFRYLGDNLLMFSTELRQTVWRRNERQGVDVFLFGDAGQVWGDNRSRSNAVILQNDRFDSSNWRASAGGGAQYRFSRQFALRIEYARSNEENKVYLSFSRGF